MAQLKPTSDTSGIAAIDSGEVLPRLDGGLEIFAATKAPAYGIERISQDPKGGWDSVWDSLAGGSAIFDVAREAEGRFALFTIDQFGHGPGRAVHRLEQWWADGP
jgi:hypothetical protein